MAVQRDLYPDENPTIYQCFNWNSPGDGTFWDRLCAQAARLKELGVSAVWMPPAYKGFGGIHDVGYGVYDMYDLGEFNQKGTIRTKYGTKDAYLACIRSLHDHGMLALADIVFNQRLGADETETVKVRRCDPNDRLHFLSDTYEIDAWTKFTFPGRKGIYDPFQYNASCFDGCDYDERTGQKGIYLFDGKHWDPNVDPDNDNFDFLMGCDLDMDQPFVQEELVRWGKWYLDFTGIDGFRMDALKHISRPFIAGWIRTMRSLTGKELPAIGEYWSGDVDRLLKDAESLQDEFGLFDVPLHFHFFDISHANGNYDLGSLFQNTLIQRKKDQAIAFVNNHDTQPGQALESYVTPWFQPAAYACILLMKDMVPCVFEGDLYGIEGTDISGLKELPVLMKLRKYAAYGDETDYFDDPDTVGFVRTGDDHHPDSGAVVILTDRDRNEKTMNCSGAFANTVLYDALGHCDPVQTDEYGNGTFHVAPGSASAYVRQEMLKKIAD